MISAFAASVVSRVPKRSRWAGPIEVMTSYLGLEPAAERRDLTRAIGAHLGHEYLGAGHEVLIDRTRESGAVVEAAWARDDAAMTASKVGDVVLRGRLAVRAR